jgi:hypothetical protein
MNGIDAGSSLRRCATGGTDSDIDATMTDVIARDDEGILIRAGRADEAEKVLLRIITEKGPSSETYGLIGRVYKDQWEAAVQRGAEREAKAFLQRAVQSYGLGFEADWRDAYPGINAATLMEVSEPPVEERKDLMPVVKYAASRRAASDTADYWDHATLLEAAILDRDEAAAGEALRNALAMIRGSWEPETTARNLRLIRNAHARRGEMLPWAEEMEHELVERAKKLQTKWLWPGNLEA